MYFMIYDLSFHKPYTHYYYSDIHSYDYYYNNDKILIEAYNIRCSAKFEPKNIMISVIYNL